MAKYNLLLTKQHPDGTVITLANVRDKDGYDISKLLTKLAKDTHEAKKWAPLPGEVPLDAA